MKETKVKIGIIGGTGLNKVEIFQAENERSVDTPFGEPSDKLKEGFINNVPCVLLPRHGRNHNINPSNVNYRANMWALKTLGCTHVLAITSCGGLQQYTKPGDLVIIDQFFDRTYRRIQTFYDGQSSSLTGVLHIPMSEPFCERTRQILIKASNNLGISVHQNGAVVTIEGPRFSSKFESKFWHQMGASVINMTTVPEVVLAKELGLCYASVAMVTDYDSWLDTVDSVDVQKVKEVMRLNVNTVIGVIIEGVKLIAEEEWEDTIKQNNSLVQSCTL